MIFTFIRHVTKTEDIYAKVLSNNEGNTTTLGILHFPNKSEWSKFYGTLANGSIAVRGLEVRMETTNEQFIEVLPERIEDDSNPRTNP